MNSTVLPQFGNSQNDLLAAVKDHGFAFGSAAALGAALLWYLTTTNEKQIKRVRGWPIVGQWAFFTRRYDFLVESFKRLPTESTFRFNLLEHNIVAMRGENARKMFFDHREISFTEGYKILMGGVPLVEDVVSEMDTRGKKEDVSAFLRHLTRLLRPERINSVTPLIMSDLERSMAKWGSHGKFDLFKDFYFSVFQVTIRTLCCREIADSEEDCKKMEKLYWQVEQGSTAASLLLPWLPSKARKLKTAATMDIFLWLDGIINARRKEDRRENDALQDLMDSGDSNQIIVQTILGALFGGISNTGQMSAWIFIFLDQEPQWKTKAISEIRALLEKYAPVSASYTSVAERLSTVPFEAWENELPVLEACLRETIRLVFTITALRRVVAGDIEFEGKPIPNGSFLVYPIAEVHLDPTIYPEPLKFNPGRYEAGQDKSRTHAYLGWGVGRHPCAGRRFAQYEIKAICAMFLASYEYEIINSKGMRPDPSTIVPDRNNTLQARPKNETFYIKYTKREQVL